MGKMRFEESEKILNRHSGKREEGGEGGGREREKEKGEERE